MTNRVTITGKLLDAPKIRTFEQKGGTIEIVSLWIEVKDEHRADRFTVEINDPKAAAAAKAMRKDVIAEASRKLRHDRWKDKASGRWTGKVFIAIDPGEGSLVPKASLRTRSPIKRRRDGEGARAGGAGALQAFVTLISSYGHADDRCL